MYACKSKKERHFIDTFTVQSEMNLLPPITDIGNSIDSFVSALEREERALQRDYDNLDARALPPSKIEETIMKDYKNMVVMYQRWRSIIGAQSHEIGLHEDYRRYRELLSSSDPAVSGERTRLRLVITNKLMSCRQTQGPSTAAAAASTGLRAAAATSTFAGSRAAAATASTGSRAAAADSSTGSRAASTFTGSRAAAAAASTGSMAAEESHSVMQREMEKQKSQIGASASTSIIGLSNRKFINMHSLNGDSTEDEKESNFPKELNFWFDGVEKNLDKMKDIGLVDCGRYNSVPDDGGVNKATCQAIEKVSGQCKWINNEDDNTQTEGRCIDVRDPKVITFEQLSQAQKVELLRSLKKWVMDTVEKDPVLKVYPDGQENPTYEVPAKFQDLIYFTVEELLENDFIKRVYEAENIQSYRSHWIKTQIEYKTGQSLSSKISQQERQKAQEELEIIKAHPELAWQASPPGYEPWKRFNLDEKRWRHLVILVSKMHGNVLDNLIETATLVRDENTAKLEFEKMGLGDLYMRLLQLPLEEPVRYDPFALGRIQKKNPTMSQRVEAAEATEDGAMKGSFLKSMHAVLGSVKTTFGKTIKAFKRKFGSIKEGEENEQEEEEEEEEGSSKKKLKLSKDGQIVASEGDKALMKSNLSIAGKILSLSQSAVGVLHSSIFANETKFESEEEKSKSQVESISEPSASKYITQSPQNKKYDTIHVIAQAEINLLRQRHRVIEWINKNKSKNESVLRQMLENALIHRFDLDKRFHVIEKLFKDIYNESNDSREKEKMSICMRSNERYKADTSAEINELINKTVEKKSQDLLKDINQVLAQFEDYINQSRIGEIDVDELEMHQLVMQQQLTQVTHRPIDQTSIEQMYNDCDYTWKIKQIYMTIDLLKLSTIPKHVSFIINFKSVYETHDNTVNRVESLFDTNIDQHRQMIEKLNDDIGNLLSTILSFMSQTSTKFETIDCIKHINIFDCVKDDKNMSKLIKQIEYVRDSLVDSMNKEIQQVKREFYLSYLALFEPIDSILYGVMSKSFSIANPRIMLTQFNIKTASLLQKLELSMKQIREELNELMNGTKEVILQTLYQKVQFIRLRLSHIVQKHIKRLAPESRSENRQLTLLNKYILDLRKSLDTPSQLQRVRGDEEGRAVEGENMEIYLTPREIEQQKIIQEEEDRYRRERITEEEEEQEKILQEQMRNENYMNMSISRQAEQERRIEQDENERFADEEKRREQRQNTYNANMLIAQEEEEERAYERQRQTMLELFGDDNEDENEQEEQEEQEEEEQEDIAVVETAATAAQQPRRSIRRRTAASRFSPSLYTLI